MHVERSSAAAATTAGSGKRARSAISRWPAFRCCGFVEQGAIAAAAEHATASASSSRHSPGHVVCVRGGAGGLQGRSLQLTSEAGERNSWWRARLARVVQQSTIRPGVLRIEMRKQQKGIFIRECARMPYRTGRRTAYVGVYYALCIYGVPCGTGNPAHRRSGESGRDAAAHRTAPARQAEAEPRQPGRRVRRDPQASRAQQALPRLLAVLALAADVVRPLEEPTVCLAVASWPLGPLA